MLQDFKEKIQKLASLRRPKVLIGLYQGRHSESIAESVRRAQKEVADVVVVGQPVTGVESIEAGSDMKEIHAKMVETVLKGGIEGIIRGNVEEHGLLVGLKEALQLSVPENELRVQNPCLIEDVKGNIVVIGPTSTVWGRNDEEKILGRDRVVF